MTWCSVIDMDGNVTEGVGVEIKTNSDKASTYACIDLKYSPITH
jgi:hypothetical protein